MLARLRSATVKLSLSAGFSQVGGGALPLLELPTTLIAVTADGMSAQDIETTLRGCPVPVIGRIFKGTLTVFTMIVCIANRGTASKYEE